MKPKELLRLVWINITQNKFKVVMTSIGIIVGAATIVMVIAIGKGGQADVADQFKNLNAGAVDISYDGGTDFGGGGSSDDSDSGMAMMAPGGGSGGGFGGGSGGGFGGGSGGVPSGDMGGGSSSGGEAPGGAPGGEMPSGDGGGMPDMGSFFGGQSDMEDRMNQENITLSEDDVDDVETFASGISAVTISYTTKSSVDGGDLDEADTYTIAGVKSNYEPISNLSLAVGSFITDDDDENKEKVCVLGASVAEEIFGSAIEAYGSVIYIDDRLYVVNGVLESMGTVASGISPDDSIFIPYATGVKYLVGSSVSPTITVLAADVNNVEGVIEEVTEVLATSYPNAEFTFEDAGSKMEAAEASNQILTMLLIAMAAIVFVVGGIGIMNVLFVSVKERTNEIGILKAIGCSKRDILLEFLAEAAAISLIGGVLGNLASLAVAPIVQYLGVRVELSASAFLIALVFAVGTGTIFGFYPAYKASNLVPVEALGAE
ncbi:ABC transporter permease [Roseburia hominis]|uniref:Macrolide ABC transporter ATP-binding protein n=1 Tax=Roseburia hominis TaxID=301301 RepID=A0A395VBA5_9FIRM|nr:ABC transporter permease [Roseburia hominis]RGS40554.1 macrolide ABC transporter ATP-binding protein [Roseburia hominis]